MGMVLTVTPPEAESKRLEFEQNTVIVGADDLCDLRLAGEGIDARQAVFIPRESHVDVFDIGVSGGILVNGTRVTHAELQPTDEVWIGSTVLHAALDSGVQLLNITDDPSRVLSEQESGQVGAGDSARAIDGTASADSSDTAEMDMMPVASSEPAVNAQTTLLDRVQTLMESIGTDKNIFESILDVLFDAVPVRRGFLALLGASDSADKRGPLRIRAHRDMEKERNADEKITVSRTILNKVLESGNAVLTSDAESDPDLAMSRSVHRLRIRAAIAVPLKADGKVIGIAYGDNRERPGALTTEHLSIMNALASIAAVAVEKMRLLQEFEAKQQIEQALRIARGIQRHFLPSSAPEVAGLDVAGVSESCDETGGDYFDYFPHADGQLSIVVADVAGHGVGSALLMATTRAAMRALLPVTSSLGHLFGELNRLLSTDLQDGRFVTAFMGKIDPATGRFQHVGAGHTPPIIVRAATGQAETLRCAAPPLGIFADTEFGEGEPVTLEAGDVVLLMTDGLMEAARADGEMFGMQRVEQTVVEAAGGTAQEIVDHLLEVVDAWMSGEKLVDDATVVALKFTG